MNSLGSYSIILVLLPKNSLLMLIYYLLIYYGWKYILECKHHYSIGKVVKVIGQNLNFYTSTSPPLRKIYVSLKTCEPSGKSYIRVDWDTVFYFLSVSTSCSNHRRPSRHSRNGDSENFPNSRHFASKCQFRFFL